jgi:hypothetical protein
MHAEFEDREDKKMRRLARLRWLVVPLALAALAALVVVAGVQWRAATSDDWRTPASAFRQPFCSPVLLRSLHPPLSAIGA